MAASANPSGNNQEGSSATQKVSSSSAAATNGAAVNSVDNGGNTGSGVDNSQTISALRHNPGISTDWTHEEQSLLEDLLAKYSSCSSLCFRFEFGTFAAILTRCDFCLFFGISSIICLFI